MIDTYLIHNVIIHANHGITLSAEYITYFVNTFGNEGLVPIAYQEKVEGEIVNRLQLSNTHTGWHILFLGNKIQISQTRDIEKNNSIGDFNTFLKEAITIWEQISRKYPQKANKLSISSEIILSEMSAEKLGSIFRHLVNPIPAYGLDKPYGWQHSFASTIEKSILERPEKITVFARILNNSSYYDKSASLKLSTLIETLTLRVKNDYIFDNEAIIDFLSSSNTWLVEVQGAIIQHLNS